MRKLYLTILLLSTASSVSVCQKQFWGTTSSGGLHGNGFIFRTDSIGDNLEIRHHFKSTEDGENMGALLLASNNKLYGLAGGGGLASQGAFSGGTFFEYDLNTDRFKVIEHFGPSNTNFPNIFLPKAEGLPGLTEVSPGLLYGLMRQGAYVFSYNMNTGAVGRPVVLPTFQGGATNGTLPNRLTQAFYKAPDGFLYASTYTNSSCPIANPNMGSIIRVNPATNEITVRYKSSCLATEGVIYNGLFTETNGKFYATTNLGGIHGKGVIFEYVPSTNTFTKKYDFNGSVLSFEATSLIVGKNGKLYGTSHGGGVAEPNLPYGGGTLYEFDLTTNTFTNKYNFLIGNSWVGDIGVFPRGLVNSTNGKIYGVTEFGVFEYNPVTSEMRKAGRFNDRGFAASLIQVCRKPAYKYQQVTTYEVCSNATVAVDLGSTNATSVVWKHDNVVDPSQTSVQLNIASFSQADAGTWICTLANECGTTVAQAITLVLSQPAQPIIATDDPLTFCMGETATLSAPEGFNQYEWSTGETSREIVVHESGSYAVSVTNANDCESPLSEGATVIVHALPASPTAIESPSYNILRAIGDSEVYEWTLNDVMLDVQTSQINVFESGTYKVRSVSQDGCRSAGFASVSFILTDTEHGTRDVITLYPNPSRGIVNVKVNSSMHGLNEVSVFNPQGIRVYTQSTRFTNEAIPINLENLGAGRYTILIRNNEKIIIEKIIIR